MKRIVGPLVLAALSSTSFLAQAKEMGFYVAPKIGLGWFRGHGTGGVFRGYESNRSD